MLDDAEALAYSDGEAREDDLFEDDAVGVDAREASRRDENGATVVQPLEDEEWARKKSDWGVGGRHTEAIRLWREGMRGRDKVRSRDGLGEK